MRTFDLSILEIGSQRGRDSFLWTLFHNADDNDGAALDENGNGGAASNPLN